MVMRVKKRVRAARARKTASAMWVTGGEESKGDSGKGDGDEGDGNGDNVGDGNGDKGDGWQRGQE